MSDHKYGCLMAVIPANLSRQLNNWIHRSIDPDHLAPEGYTDEPHVTVKHGFVDGSPEQAESLVELLSDSGPFSITIDGISFFKGNEDGDVLKLDISSETLHKLNSLVSRAFKCRDKYPDYKPHLTLAYLDPKFSKQYESLKCPCAGLDITIGELVYSAPDKTRTRISLMSNVGDRGSKTEKDSVVNVRIDDLIRDEQNLREARDNIIRGLTSQTSGPVKLYRKEGEERFVLGDGYHRSVEAEHRGDSHITGVIAKEILPNSKYRNTNSGDVGSKAARGRRMTRREVGLGGEPDAEAPLEINDLDSQAPRDRRNRPDPNSIAGRSAANLHERDNDWDNGRLPYQLPFGSPEQEEAVRRSSVRGTSNRRIGQMVEGTYDPEEDPDANSSVGEPIQHTRPHRLLDMPLDVQKQRREGKSVPQYQSPPAPRDMKDRMDATNAAWQKVRDEADAQRRQQYERFSNYTDQVEELLSDDKSADQPLQPNPNRMSMDEQHNWVYDHFGDKLDEYDDSDPETRKEAIEAHQLVREHRAEQDYLNNRDQKYLIRPSPFIGRKRLVPPCIKSNHQHDINAMLSHIRDTGDHDALLPLSDAMEEQGHQDKAEAARKLHRHGYLRGTEFPHLDENHNDTPENRRRSAYEYLSGKPLSNGSFASGWTRAYGDRPSHLPAGSGAYYRREGNHDEHITFKDDDGAAYGLRFRTSDEHIPPQRDVVHHHAEGFNRYMDEQERNQQNNKRLALSHIKSHDEDMTENLDRPRSPRPHKGKPPDILEDMAVQGPAQNSEDYYDSLAELYEQQRERQRFRQEKSIRSGSIGSRNRVKALRRLYGNKTLSSTNVNLGGALVAPPAQGRIVKLKRGKNIDKVEAIINNHITNLEGRYAELEEDRNHWSYTPDPDAMGPIEEEQQEINNRIDKARSVLNRHKNISKVDQYRSVNNEIGRQLSRRVSDRINDAEEYANQNTLTPEQRETLTGHFNYFNGRDSGVAHYANESAYRDIYGISTPSTPQQKEEYEQQRARAITQQVTSRSDKEKQKFPDALDYVNMAIPKKPGEKSLRYRSKSASKADLEAIKQAARSGDPRAFHAWGDHLEDQGNNDKADAAHRIAKGNYIDNDEIGSARSVHNREGNRHVPTFHLYAEDANDRRNHRIASAMDYLEDAPLRQGSLASARRDVTDDLTHEAHGLITEHKPGKYLNTYRLHHPSSSHAQGLPFRGEEIEHHAGNWVRRQREQEGQKALGRKSIVFPRVAPSPFARQKATGPEEYYSEIEQGRHADRVSHIEGTTPGGRRIIISLPRPEKGKTSQSYRSGTAADLDPIGDITNQVNQVIQNERLGTKATGPEQFRRSLNRMEHRRGTKAAETGPETFRREWRQGKRPQREYHERPVLNEQGEEVGIAYTHTEKGKSPESYRETIRQNS